MALKPGPDNSILDIAGILVGNAQDETLKSGVTAVVCEEPMVASAMVLGGAPGTRDLELLQPHQTVEKIDAIALSGGSAFGLDAGSGIQAWLRENDRGLQVGPVKIPIVPGAIIFDIVNGGDKDWGRFPPYQQLGYEAAKNAGEPLKLGSFGAGCGALVAGLKGGLGSASIKLENGITIAALSVVNSVGSPTIGDSACFWAHPFEIGGEFGNILPPSPLPNNTTDIAIKYRDLRSPAANTAIAVVATDANLTKAQAKRLAISAHDGIARAVWPVHTPIDGDLVFALATGSSDHKISTDDWIDLGAHAASVMSRSIARAIYDATPAPNDIYPCWQEKFGA